MSSKLKSADIEVEDLNDKILACEKKIYESFLGLKPDAKALQKLLLPDYLYINSRGFIWTKEENIASLKSGVAFSSIEIKNPQVIKISATSAVIVARVFMDLEVEGRSFSTETLTSTVWVKHGDNWLAQLHTSTAAAPD